MRGCLLAHRLTTDLHHAVHVIGVRSDLVQLREFRVGTGDIALTQEIVRLRPQLMHDPEGGHHKSVRPVVNDMIALAERVRSEAIQHAVVSMPHVSSAKLAEIVDHYTGIVPHLLVLSHCSTLPALWGAARGCGGLSGIEVRNGLLLRTLQQCWG